MKRIVPIVVIGVYINFHRGFNFHQEYSHIGEWNLEELLVKAPVGTYASGREGREKLLGDGSNKLIFEEGEFSYRDRYFGWNPFIGEEVVFHSDRIIWAMNYYGLVFDEVVPAVDV